ncbi:trypsin-like serine peptidase [Tenacibaculum amylolyticum]|uniref:trypsin-like serine peptidase n=1 Tax=Tenacibaculum amylolyticum TaxID=104269 RepID=UPI0038941ECE
MQLKKGDSKREKIDIKPQFPTTENQTFNFKNNKLRTDNNFFRQEQRIDPEKIYNEVFNKVNDPEVLDEIKSIYNFSNNNSFIESFKENYVSNIDKSSIFNRTIVENLDDEEIYTIAAETIVLKFGRPSLLIKKDKVEIPESEVWKKRLNTHIFSIEQNIPNVGRIELINHSHYDWCGTGWLIKDTNFIVTNRHVARVFSQLGTSNHFRFRYNLDGKKVQPFIDFKEEYREPDEATFRLEKVVYISKENEPDVAILEVNSNNYDNDVLPVGLEISDTPIINDDFVYTIGYPAKDSRIVDSSLMERIFKGVYNVKRLAPGTANNITQPHLFQHNCSTLGGNSGSPVINLKTGKVIGLHFAGTYRKYNWAVESDFLNSLLHQLS